MSLLHCRFVQCLLALPLSCYALPSHAQQSISADEAVRMALSRPEIRREIDAGPDIARSDVLAARTWPNPELEVAREQVADGPLGPSTETSAILTQQFDMGGRRRLYRHAAEYAEIAANATAEYERLHVKHEVLRSYHAAASAEQRVQVQTSLSAGLRELALMANLRRRAGDLSGYESRRIVQASSQSETRLARAEADAGVARAELAAWIGEIALSASLSRAIPMVPDIAADDARGIEVDMLRARRDHAVAEERAASRISLPVKLGIGRKRITQGSFSDDAVVMEVGIPLPIFDRGRAERLRAAAEAQRVSAAYQRATAQLQSRRAATLARAIRLSESARKLQDDVVPEAARLTEIARGSFAEGELDLSGLLDAYDAHASAVEQASEQRALALDALLELELLSSSPTTIQQRNHP